MALDMSDVWVDNLIDNNYSKYNNNSVKTDVDPNDPSTGYVDFEGYLTLLAAQMSNQDFNNSMSDSEFIQQMASYSMMEAISQMNKQSQLTYSSSLIGKAVTVTDENNAPDTGIVEAVTMTKDGCQLLVNGNQYASSKITDIVDGEIYMKLNMFTGHKVEIDEGENEDGENVTTQGTVTSVYISGGNGYVVLDKKNTYPLNMVSKILDVSDEDEKTEEGDKTESGSEASGTESGGTSDESGTDVSAASASLSAAVSESAAASASGNVYRGTVGVTSRNSSGNSGNEGFDTLLDMLDNDDFGGARGLMSYASAAVRSNLENIAARRIAQVDESAAASGVSGDSDRVPAPSVYNGYIASNSDSNYTQSNINGKASLSYSANTLSARSGVRSDRTPAPSVYNNSLPGRNVNAANNTSTAADSTVNARNTSGGVTSQNNLKQDSGSSVNASTAKSTYDTGAQYGSISVADMNAAAQNLETFRNTSDVMTTGTTSTRSYAPEYVLEAAFADSVGTRMGDIRYIGNTDIMNRIDTSEIIAYMQSGRAVTDIGWCGRGRLGEVLTFPDGKQRVEVILGDDISYFYTSGKYTLSELFDKNVPAGYWVDKLTPQEIAIMHYGEEYTEAEKAQMEAFEQYCLRHSATYMGY